MGKQLDPVVEEEIRDGQVKAQRNLTRWKTIYIGRKWYLLTDELRQILSEAIALGLQQDTQEVRMEVATGRNGQGTGQFATILVLDALTPLGHNH